MNNAFLINLGYLFAENRQNINTPKPHEQNLRIPVINLYQDFHVGCFKG